jgi:hypothetical protein
MATKVNKTVQEMTPEELVLALYELGAFSSSAIVRLATKSNSDLRNLFGPILVLENQKKHEALKAKKE